MPSTLDPAAVRHWCTRALDALRRGREDIDTINVFPVADGDTGSNLCLTLAAADRALRAPEAECRTVAEAMRTAAHGALLGACGNSGTILAQLMRGMAEVYADPDGGGEPSGADLLRRGLRRAADAAYEAVAHPVEGTMLSVARAAADAAAATPGNDGAAVARAARDGARTALAATPGQLAVLARAGVVDAGGRGLLVVLDALAATLSGEEPDPPEPARPPAAPDNPPRPAPEPRHAPRADGEEQPSPAFEVMYLLDADEDAVHRLRGALDGLGDSLVVIGGEGLWNVHVHVDDAGAAVEAGIAAGRPHRVRITHLASAPDRHTAGATPDCAGEPPPERTRAVVAVVRGEGLAGLCEEAGACVVRAPAGGGADEDTLTAAVRGCGAREIVLLPNDPELHATAVRAAERARTHGVRVAVVPTRAAVQGIAALAVHDPGARFDEDVVAMTSAAGATRYGEVAVAAREAWTTAGVCQAGDVLGLVEGDVAVIGDDVAGTASDVLERMLAAGGEMVTLVVGPHAPDGLAARLEAQVRRGHLGVDTVVYEGRAGAGPLLVGVE
ncbi:DAK2 domain-containing protein [Streptomyces sp. DSM 42041]|uniref:DAK2 domain-containing protein n=1 Tax=Streptomyces hazeniae TaxID=3075538 RepID=A0ABU2NP09_9ACTN|nr:DAK2 domain-containing protein [Streptomyces sp. DSM 42041]MDT0378720.1 DAK2 domain-containing protein [Streptomyces sp. DSM 42041]